MKKIAVIFLTALMLLSGCSGSDMPVPSETAAPETMWTVPPTVPTTMPPRPQITETPFVPVLDLTAEEKTMLLKIGMAERGNTECTECIALIMCTVLNRVESGRFGSSIRSVLFAQDQFTPVMDGSYQNAIPNELCYDALDMVIYGWDESQGALYYEWCTGESWHSKNLHLLFQHCDNRFYD